MASVRWEGGGRVGLEPVDQQPYAGLTGSPSAGPVASQPFTAPPTSGFQSGTDYWTQNNQQYGDRFASNANVNNAFQKYLGRPFDVNSGGNPWANDPNYESNIYNSEEAYNYRQAHPTGSAATTTGGGGDPQALWQSWYQSAGTKPRQSLNTSLQPFADYLKSQGINATVNVDPNGYGKGININGQFIKLLDGSDNPIWLPGGEGASGSTSTTGTGGYSDPSSQLYLNTLLSRIQELRQPVQDPMAPLYQLMALSRVQNLQGDPYTSGNDAALIAHYMNPLTQARDAQLQQNKERIGARGMLPTSGLLDELNKNTNASYDQGVATASNNLGVQAVNEAQKRQQEQLSVLADLVNLSKSQRAEQTAQSNDLVSTAAKFPAFDEQRLQELLAASGDNSTAATASQSLLGQGTQNLQQRLLAANDQAARDSAWGEFFGSLLNNWGSIFH